jgi:ABC-type glycerol-3-phosphate transport system permease component
MAVIRTKTAEAALPAQSQSVVAGYMVRKLFGRLLTYAILILIALVEIFPLVWMLFTSVKDQREVFAGSLLPQTFHFDNYIRVWNTIDAPRHFANSILVTAITIVIVVTVSTLAGYAFARFTFPGNNVIFYMFLMSMIIPGQVTLIPLFIFFKNLGLLNTLPGLSFSYLGGALPFAIFLLRAFFRTLPTELRDAGLIDGLTEFGVFLRIYLPLAKPGLATVVIFQFLGTWNEFMFATTFMQTPANKTIQSALYNAMGRYSTDWTALCAGLSMAVLPVIIVYLLLQRQFQQGLTAGAIKG